jgi:ABC transport system ATP-binding/permease protein
MRLVISDNEGAMAVVPLVRDEITIGRKEGNTIRLTERNISRQHCRIRRVSGSFVISDLDSYNGVLVNGQRVAGELPVQPGDEIRVGDYTLLLEAVPRGQAAPEPPAAETIRSAETEADELRTSEPPPRLVVLTAPSAGAEFSLPAQGELRIGRSVDLDIAIDHRSVSREHAKISCADAEIRIVDLGSVNGVIVNGRKVAEAKLAPDDLIELGDIRLRFLGAGQQFVFDPHSVPAATAHKRTIWIAAAITAVAVLAALLVLRSSGGPKRALIGAEMPSSGSTPAAEVTPPTAQVGQAEAAQLEQRAALVEACRKANQAERFAEAIANANAALKLAAEDAEALACANIAAGNHEQEQVSVRARAALEQGDEETAWREVRALTGEGPVARRKDVLETVALAVQTRLRQARELLASDPDEAALVAREAADLALAPEPFRVDARDLATEADVLARSASAARTRRAKIRAEPSETFSAGPRPSATGAQATTGTSPMETASACLVRGDNLCVIRALNNRAGTPQELALLIETFRTMGNVDQAYRNMASYVQRFPAANRAEAYREMLKRAPR